MNENRMPVPLESAEMAMVVRWAQWHEQKWPELELLYHIPNEGKRSVVTGAHMKMQGMKSGVPDLHLPVPRETSHGLYVEMKRRKGETPTQDQADWLEKLDKQGYCVCWARGWEEAAQAIKEYLMHGKVTYNPTRGRAGQYHAREVGAGCEV